MVYSRAVIALYGVGVTRGRPFFYSALPLPAKTSLHHLLINGLFTTTTIWWGMPFHSTLPWFRTITPTATGLNECHDKKQNQSSPESFLHPYSPLPLNSLIPDGRLLMQSAFSGEALTTWAPWAGLPSETGSPRFCTCKC